MLKVRSLGIRGKLADWIHDFISGRKQRVCIKDNKSSWADVTSGVPQGSVLGPLLFVIFINDLPEVVDCLVKLYADDTKIYQIINNTDDAERFQQNIKQLWKWSIEWQLKFHPDKCHILHLGKTNGNHHYYTGEEHRTDLESTEEEKDLGVLIDTKLNFSSQCDKIVTTANKLLGIMRRSFTHLDKVNFCLIYKAIIRPVIEYASSVYDPILMKDMNKIESIQRRATKMVQGLQDKSYEDRLKYLDLPSLRFRRVRGDMINVYKYVHEVYKVDSSHLLPLNDTNRTRGHPFKLKATNCKSRERLHFFTQRVINKWNNLSPDTVCAISVDAFKNKLDNEWKDREGKHNFTSTWFENWRH